MIREFHVLKYCIDTNVDSHGISRKLEKLSKSRSYIKCCKEVEEANRKYILRHMYNTTIYKEQDTFQIAERRNKQHLNKCVKFFMPS